VKPSGGPNDVERLVRDFLDGQRTADELSNGLRDYALRPDIGLRAFSAVNIDWEQVQQERLVAFMEVSARITGPTLESFFAGEISVDDAAVQVAPFFLMWHGFGIDAPADADSSWLERWEQLTQRIVELHRET
jgi:hypothetical protein